MILTLPVRAGRLDIQGPPGSLSFGSEIKVLPNGNFVVVDEQHTPPGMTVAAGGVFLYSRDGALISALTGGRDQDRIGSGGVTVLANGHFVVSSPAWDNGSAVNAGAVTWGSMTEGVSGVVSQENSLVGGRSEDQVGGPAGIKGAGGIIALSNGHYVVCSPAWDNGLITRNAGAVTHGDGAHGTKGFVSSANSLVGAATNGMPGVTQDSYGVMEVGSGNYVVNSPSGVVWCDGASGRTGVFSAADALTGAAGASVTVLSTGDYVVANPLWGDGNVAELGAVTWCPGNTGRTGAVAAANSLIGTSYRDRIGSGVTAGQGVIPLRNGNFVVISPLWDNGDLIDRGAITWCPGGSGAKGTVTAADSVIGTAARDMDARVLPLSTGDYAIAADLWDNGGAVDAGAVRLLSGVGPSSGELTPENSLVGLTGGDRVSSGPLTALPSGNFVISSPLWSKGQLAGAGAVTWVDGTVGLTGPVTAANSLTGTEPGDHVGGAPANSQDGGGVILLSNGHYVVSSPRWSAGRGAVTWGDGTKGITGEVTGGNSITGSNFFQYVGGRGGGVTALTNGNYVISSPSWSVRPSLPFSGAAPSSGVVSTENSLYMVVGAMGSKIGETPPMILPDGNFLQFGAPSRAEYVLPVSGIRPTAVEVNSDIVLRGGAITSLRLTSLNTALDAARQRLLVSNHAKKMVSIYTNLSPDLPKFRVRRVNGPALASGGIVDFGEAARNSTVTVQLTVRNPGAVPLILWMERPSDPAFSVPLPESVTVPPKGEISLPVAFTPVAAGPRSADISLRTNDPDAPEFAFKATGTGSEIGNRFTRDLMAPQGGGAFGSAVAWLPNGNLVVTAPEYGGPDPLKGTGAVYLFSPSGTLISTVTGAVEGDRAGLGGVTVLPNGNYLILSRLTVDGKEGWGLTFANGETGVSGKISPANSLVADTANFWPQVIPLPGGNYVVSDRWALNGRHTVTWGSGTAGVAGRVSTDNSLVPLAPDQGTDAVVTILSNGNYVVSRPGFVTFGSGSSSTSGMVSESNSLVSPEGTDTQGMYVQPLTDGNYLAVFPQMKVGDTPQAGAVIWCDGMSGRKGVLQPREALTGGRYERLGLWGTFPMPGGGYAVQSTFPSRLGWCRAGGGLKGPVSESGVAFLSITAPRLLTLPNGNMVLTGATTSGHIATAWMSPGFPPNGELTAENALLSNSGDHWVSGGVTVLDDGHYVVTSPAWPEDGPLARQGAVTWCDGGKGRVGWVGPENSLTGGAPGAFAGSGGIVSLKEGRYVLLSPAWGSGGAVTWMQGDTEGAGSIHSGNSLHGENRLTGSQDILPLANGNYVIHSKAGEGSMITWLDGRRPATGRLSEFNSMTDTKAKATVLPLANGNYMVSWSVPNDSPPPDFLGAVTWADGRKGISGKVSAGNSILYTAGGDSRWRQPMITSWPDSAYAVLWREAVGNGAESAGAMVFGNGYSQDTGKGAPNFLNSVRGESAYNGPGMNTSYDAVRKTWAVGSPRENRVSLFSYSRPAEAVISLEEPGGLDLPAGSVMDFGLIAVGESQERTVTIMNRGDRSLRLEKIMLDDPQFRLMAPPASSELAPGGGTGLVLRFTPASPGAKSAVLHLPSDDPAQPVITLTLRGIAKASAEKPFGEEPAAATITPLAGGLTSVGIQAAPGMSYLLQRSQDLKTWSSGWLIMADDSGMVNFTDNTGNHSPVFYRLKTR